MTVIVEPCRVLDQPGHCRRCWWEGLIQALLKGIFEGPGLILDVPVGPLHFPIALMLGHRRILHQCLLFPADPHSVLQSQRGRLLVSLEDELAIREAIEVAAHHADNIVTVHLATCGFALKDMCERLPSQPISKDKHCRGTFLIPLPEECEVATDHWHLGSTPLCLPVERPVRCIGRLAPHAMSTPRLKGIMSELVNLTMFPRRLNGLRQ